MDSHKRALAEITSPYRLLQVFWIAVQYPDYEWDIVLRYIDGKMETLERMKRECISSGLFTNVFFATETNKELNGWDKIKKALSLIFTCITGRRKKVFKRDIEKVVGEFNYDLVLVEPSFALFSCEIMYFGKDIDVRILEDGAWDYTFNNFEYDRFTMLVGRIFYYLGIYNFAGFKFFKLNKYCIKYATDPDNVIERNFKEIRPLFCENEYSDKYNHLLEKVYTIKHIDCDAVLFTNGIVENNDELYKQKALEWVEQNYKGKKILIKLHPLDNFQYESNEITCSIHYKTVPGEVLLSVFKDKPLIFMFPSTLILYLNKDKVDYKVLDYSDDYISSGFRSAFDRIIEALHVSSEQIVKIE